MLLTNMNVLTLHSPLAVAVRRQWRNRTHMLFLGNVINSDTLN